MEVIKTNTGLIKAWTDGVQFEDSARLQAERLADMPFIHKHISIMPDVHMGKGATVGSVIPTAGAIIPAAVGCDIGCGMMAIKTSLTADDLPDNLKAIRSHIESKVPHGRTDNGGANDRGAWKNPSHFATKNYTDLDPGLKLLTDKHPKLKRAAERAIKHMGTLGSGNHFIEMCLDENQAVWIMLHSGSRGIGNAIGSYFIDLARQDMKKWFINLPDIDLAYIPQGSEHFSDYMAGLAWAQKYALTNRETMMEEVLRVIRHEIKPFDILDQAINCHHNYVSQEKHFGQNVFVTRKGAVSARLNELGIIPGSMGAMSFIVRGKGNRESFCSCSHGAGRKMSRNEAKNTFTVKDHEAATEGVECRKDKEVIDETPMAYKDIQAVMKAQEDLVDVVATLKQVLCVKG